MSAVAILSQLQSAGIFLRADNGRLLASPKRLLTGPLLELVRTNKSALLDHLEDYTSADLEEMDRLISQLGQLEGWTEAELSEALDHRQRMAPCRVLLVLRQLREWVATRLARWPEQPEQRAPIKLFELCGCAVRPASNTK